MEVDNYRKESAISSSANCWKLIASLYSPSCAVTIAVSNSCIKSGETVSNLVNKKDANVRKSAVGSTGSSGGEKT